MSACIVKYNKVSGEVTITADAAKMFEKTLMEYHNQVSMKAYLQREALMDNPQHELTRLGLDINKILLSRLEECLGELKKVTDHERQKEIEASSEIETP